VRDAAELVRRDVGAVVGQQDLAAWHSAQARSALRPRHHARARAPPRGACAGGAAAEHAARRGRGGRLARLPREGAGGGRRGTSRSCRPRRAATPAASARARARAKGAPRRPRPPRPAAPRVPSAPAAAAAAAAPNPSGFRLQGSGLRVQGCDLEVTAEAVLHQGERVSLGDLVPFRVRSVSAQAARKGAGGAERRARAEAAAGYPEFSALAFALVAREHLEPPSPAAVPRRPHAHLQTNRLRPARAGIRRAISSLRNHPG